ncbi:MAG: alkaline phosphatase family protein, partial [bacterium]|nr:alkaline phosphatase family protein [bacterium]
LDKRFNVLEHCYNREKWDYFHCHVMETDRISHFYWREMESGQGEYYEKFMEFFSEIDRRLEKFYNMMDKDSALMVLSDHGFCLARKELNLNKWFEDEGYLKFNKPDSKSVEDMSPETIAYSLIPGRIYINLKGREEKGSVANEDYEKYRDEIITKLTGLKDPETGEVVIIKVHKREDIYDGEYINEVADLIAIGPDGIDIKGNIKKEKLLEEGFISGMHTYDDAFFYLKSELPEVKIESIRDCFNLVCEVLGIDRNE